MNILMICEFYDESLEFQENLLVKYYGKHGHQVTVVTSTYDSVFDYYNDRHDKSRPGRTYRDHGARIIKLPYRYNLLNRLRAYTRIDAILEEAKPDLIYVHDIMPNIPEAIAYVRRHPECRMILDYHADYSNSGKNWLSLRILHGVLRKHFLDRARPHLSRIFPVVPASATFLHEVYGVPHSEMEVLPLGADMDLVRCIRSDGSRASLRKSLAIRDDEIVIFTGGKLTLNRRTEILFDAVALLESLPLRIVVVGDSGDQARAYRDYLEDKARGRQNIQFTGWLGKEDIYRHMSMSDLAVFPASQSIMWQQAIATGLPLIVGDTGSQDISYLNLEDNIVILRGEDIRPERFAEEIERVVSTPGRLTSMARGAEKVAAEQLDWDRLIDRTLRFNVAIECRVPEDLHP
jgi:glycosyltransferase involved in cell wall biosynthesis